MKPIAKVIFMALLALLCQACATTRVSNEGDAAAFCGDSSASRAVLLLWHTRWRPD